MRRSTTLAAFTLVLTLLASSAAEAAYRPPGAKRCGTLRGTANMLTFKVFARQVACAQARRVFARTVNNQYDLIGWECVQYVFSDGTSGTRCVGPGPRRVYGIPTRDPGSFD